MHILQLEGMLLLFFSNSEGIIFVSHLPLRPIVFLELWIDSQQLHHNLIDKLVTEKKCLAPASAFPVPWLSVVEEYVCYRPQGTTKHHRQLVGSSARLPPHIAPVSVPEEVDERGGQSSQG